MKFYYEFEILLSFAKEMKMKASFRLTRLQSKILRDFCFHSQMHASMRLTRFQQKIANLDATFYSLFTLTPIRANCSNSSGGNS